MGNNRDAVADCKDEFRRSPGMAEATLAHPYAVELKA